MDTDAPGPSDHPVEEPERAFFGRRKGKRLRGQQERRLAELLPSLRVDLPPGDAILDPRALFPAGWHAPLPYLRTVRQPA